MTTILSTSIDPDLKASLNGFAMQKAETKRLRKQARNLRDLARAQKVAAIAPALKFTADDIAKMKVPDLRREASANGLKGARVAKRDALEEFLANITV